MPTGDNPMADEEFKRKLTDRLRAAVEACTRRMGQDQVFTVRTLRMRRELMSIHDRPSLEMGTNWCFQFRNEDILSMSRKSRIYTITRRRGVPRRTSDPAD